MLLKIFSFLSLVSFFFFFLHLVGFFLRHLLCVFFSLVQQRGREVWRARRSVRGACFVSEVEDLLLPGGLGWKVLLLLAGLVGSLQAALLEVLEPGSHRGLGALCRPGGRTGTLVGGSKGAGEDRLAVSWSSSGRL